MTNNMNAFRLFLARLNIENTIYDDCRRMITAISNNTYCYYR